MRLHLYARLSQFCCSFALIFLLLSAQLLGIGLIRTFLDPERAHHLLPDIVCIYFKNKLTISDYFVLMAEDDSMNDE